MTQQRQETEAEAGALAVNYRYDIRGSVTTIVDGEGAVVKSYDYDEFGVTTASGTAGFLNGQYQVQVSPFLNGMRIICKDPIITRCFQNGAIGM